MVIWELTSAECGCGESAASAVGPCAKRGYTAVHPGRRRTITLTLWFAERRRMCVSKRILQSLLVLGRILHRKQPYDGISISGVL